MPIDGENIDIVAIEFVYQAILLGDSSRPKAIQVVLQPLGLSGTYARVSSLPIVSAYKTQSLRQSAG